MLHPFWLVSHIKNFKCRNCRRFPRSEVHVHSQAILPARGAHVILRLEYYCRHCGMITPVAEMVSNAQVTKILIDAIRGGRFGIVFREPVEVAVRMPVSPSILPGAPSEPIDDAEVERASRILKRTSFKRDSKSWKQFMDRLERGK